ncbi:MAG: hypothetical protein U9R42_09485 [Bacteroidota bacterium]|nr:hypothetical protein [Bacteroidota bacterium]
MKKIILISLAITIITVFHTYGQNDFLLTKKGTKYPTKAETLKYKKDVTIKYENENYLSGILVKVIDDSLVSILVKNDTFNFTVNEIQSISILKFGRLLKFSIIAGILITPLSIAIAEGDVSYLNIYLALLPINAISGITGSSWIPNPIVTYNMNNYIISNKKE